MTDRGAAVNTSRPTSVLIFLGACLAFAEALAGTAGSLDSKMSGIWVLSFGTLNLVVVLLSLLYMFWKKPEFLIAERGDLVPLRVIEAIAAQDNVKLVQELIKSFNWAGISADPAAYPAVDPSELQTSETDRRKLEEQQAKLKRKESGGA